jgi:deferrochelatase/peroxidase EfeB
MPPSQGLPARGNAKQREAVGSPVSRLTITIGYGPALFDHRFGLAARKPATLADLPPLPNENLDPDYTGGDLCIQACSDNPLVAFHAGYGGTGIPRSSPLLILCGLPRYAAFPP